MAGAANKSSGKHDRAIGRRRFMPSVPVSDQADLTSGLADLLSGSEFIRSFPDSYIDVIVTDVHGNRTQMFQTKLQTKRGHIVDFVTGRKTLSNPGVPGHRLDDALAAARARGQQRAAAILSGNDMLSAEDFGQRVGATRASVNNWRKAGRVLGLSGAKRGFRYPAWQISPEGGPYEVLPELFDRLGGSSWAVYRFLVQHHPELSGRTGAEALAEGDAALVVDAAESVARAFA